MHELSTGIIHKKSNDKIQCSYIPSRRIVNVQLHRAIECCTRILRQNEELMTVKVDEMWKAHQAVTSLFVRIN
jgi:hypothetical protein